MSFLPSLGPSSECVPYPMSVSGHLASGTTEEGSAHSLLTRGCLSSNGAALLYRGPCLEVMSIHQNERCSSESFPTEITSLDSLGSDQVVIGLDSGVVSVLDIKISKLIKSISFPERISSLAVIHDSASRSLAEELMFFKGILAVGTQSGDLYLLDLALDKDSEDNEALPPLFISPGLTTELADLRLGTQNHLCIHLNDDSNNAASGKENRGLVISALAHLPQLGCIAVGYNSGAWKLWNLSRLNTEFTFSHTTNLLPCVGFAFQEPENDPRNHSYLWVMRSQNDVDTEDDKKALNTFATIDLYALRYENKDEVDQYGVLYSGLTSCSKSFGFTLGGDPEDLRRARGSMGLTTRTLGTSSRQSGLDISGTECDSIYTQGLCIFMWEVRSYDDPRSKYFLGVFDLNMWYQDQMPLEYMGEDVCAFLSYCSMEDALSSCPEASILDVHVDLASISRCKSSVLSEKNAYPSSLAFEMIAILDSGFVQTSHLGLQKKVLLELQTEGHSSLVEPYNLYKLCCIAGFIHESHLGGKLEQRSALLTVALEHNLVNLLTGCVSYWSDGKYSEEGCTMKALLDWAWQRIISIKQMIDKVTAPLFDLSSLHFNENNQMTLIQNSQQLHHLSAVIQELISQSVVASQIGFEELQIKMNVVRLVNLYVRVVLWFFSASLLPELPEPEAGSIPLLGRDSPYPYTELSLMYKNKRRQMKVLHSNWGYSDVPLLLIDGLCSQFGSKLCSNFERDGGDGLYPPPTLFSILSAYLIDDHRSCQVNDVGKHRLIHYLFLDMADKRCNDEIWSDMIDRLIQFPSAFSVPPSVIKLTQAFWLLDQGDFEEAMGMLLDPLILDKDIQGWEHRTIIVSFLVQDHPKSALKYSRIRKPPVRDAFDIKLHVSVLLSTGNVHEAFQFQRNRRNTCKDLLHYFFVQAEKLGKLNLLFELTLTSFEETEFINFLQNSESSSEVLLMYYLQRYRFQEAQAYHRLLKQKNLSTPTHQALMSRYSNLLPNLLLVENKGYETLKVSGPSKIPVPLSREIKMTNFNPLFHTSVIETQLENSLGPHSAAGPFTPFRPRGQRINPIEKRRFVEVSKTKDDEEDDLIVQTPPAKKSRFIETKSFLNDKPSPPNKPLPPAFTEEVTSILCTPTIKRCSSRLPRRNALEKQEDEEPSARSPFPQEPKKLTPSILKNTPPPKSLKNSAAPQEDSSAKSLRFNMPKKLPPPELKPVNLMQREEEDVEVISVGSSSSVDQSSHPDSKDSSPSKCVVASRRDIKIGQSFSLSPFSSSSRKAAVETRKERSTIEEGGTPSTSSHIQATPRKPIADYLMEDSSSNESPAFRSSLETPRLSSYTAKRIQSTLLEKEKQPAAVEPSECGVEEEEEDDCLVMSEGESDVQSERESESEVLEMIKDAATADFSKFIPKEKDVGMRKSLAPLSPFSFKTRSSKPATKESPSTVENLIKSRATMDFNQFIKSSSSSVATRTTTSEFKTSSTSTSDFSSEAIKEQASADFNFARSQLSGECGVEKEEKDDCLAMSEGESDVQSERESESEVLEMIKDAATADFSKFIPKEKDVRMRKSLAPLSPFSFKTRSSKPATKESPSTVENLIKSRATMDFNQFIKSSSSSVATRTTTSEFKTSSTSESKSKTIYIENTDGKSDEEVTPDKIKAKALQSAQEWAQKSPFIGPSSSKKPPSHRDPIHSDALIKESAEKDFGSFLKAPEAKPSSSPSSSFALKSASVPFMFSNMEESEGSSDSELLDDEEDECPVEEGGEAQQPEPEFNFAVPVSYDEGRDENVLFQFSEGKSLEPSVCSEAEATNEFENVKFTFTKELSSVMEDEADTKVQFSFSEPKERTKESSIAEEVMESLPEDKKKKSPKKKESKDRKSVSPKKRESPVRKSVSPKKKESPVRKSDSPKQKVSPVRKSESSKKKESPVRKSESPKKKEPQDKKPESPEKKDKKRDTPKKKDPQNKMQESPPLVDEAPQSIRRSKRISQLGGDKAAPLKGESSKAKAVVSNNNEEDPKVEEKKSPVVVVNPSESPQIVDEVSKKTRRKFFLNTSSPAKEPSHETPARKRVSDKGEAHQKTTPRKLRSTDSVERELTPSVKAEKKTRVSTPRRHRTSSLSEERELTTRPRRSKRLSHSSVLPVLSTSRISEEDSSKTSIMSESRLNTSSDNVVAEESLLNVIQEEEESDVGDEGPSTPKRSFRTKKAPVHTGALSLEKVMEEDEEEESNVNTTPLRKSKRLSAKSQTYDLEAKKKPTPTKSDNNAQELMYEHEEPFDTSSSSSLRLGEEEDEKKPASSPDKKPFAATRRKKYVVKKKVVSQKIFF